MKTYDFSLDPILMSLVGKTVKSVSYPSQYRHITLTFTDGTNLCVKEVGCVGEIRVFLDSEEIEIEEK